MTSRKFLSGEYDHVYLLYNAFKSAINQVVTLDELLPVAPETSGDTADIFMNQEQKRYWKVWYLAMWASWSGEQCLKARPLSTVHV